MRFGCGPTCAKRKQLDAFKEQAFSDAVKKMNESSK